MLHIYHCTIETYNFISQQVNAGVNDVARLEEGWYTGG